MKGNRGFGERADVFGDAVSRNSVARQAAAPRGGDSD
jgi:hypothetical protein